jgi:chromosome segregation ATPase
MTMNDRLMQSAEWCEEVAAAYPNSDEWARLPHLAQDFRDAAESLTSTQNQMDEWLKEKDAMRRGLEIVREEAERSLKSLLKQDREIAILSNEVSALKEQLDIARTALSDVESFREREKKHAEAVMTGLQIAISAMALGLKGGK